MSAFVTEQAKRPLRVEVSSFHSPNAWSLSTSLKKLENIQVQLLTVMGYELWTPLSSLQICLESLTEEQLPSHRESSNLMDMALESVQHLQYVFEQFLNFAYHSDEPISVHARELQSTLTSIIEMTGEQHDNQQLYSAPEGLPLGWRSPTVGRNFTDPMEVKSHESSQSLKHQVKVLEHIKRNLVAIVGHELRTPLTSIEICLETIASFPEMEAKSRQIMLETALTDIKRLQYRLEDFFTLARLEKAQIAYLSDVVFLPESLEMAVHGFKVRRAAERLPQIILDVAPDLPPMHLDGDRLMEAIDRLLDNACKFTESSGQVTISATLTNRPKANYFETNHCEADYQESSSANSTHEVIKRSDKSETELALELVVSDTGRGIEPINLTAIFNSFYQEEDALKRTAGGTGIGLTICRKIAEQLGGRIWATSAGKTCGSGIHLQVPVRLAVV